MFNKNVFKWHTRNNLCIHVYCLYEMKSTIISYAFKLSMYQFIALCILYNVHVIMYIVQCTLHITFNIDFLGRIIIKTRCTLLLSLDIIIKLHQQVHLRVIGFCILLHNIVIIRYDCTMDMFMNYDIKKPLSITLRQNNGIKHNSQTE